MSPKTLNSFRTLSATHPHTKYSQPPPHKLPKIIKRDITPFADSVV